MYAFHPVIAVGVGVGVNDASLFRLSLPCNAVTHIDRFGNTSNTATAVVWSLLLFNLDRAPIEEDEERSFFGSS